jgi:ribosomal protein S18 acetylase RimI-like enzyme
MIIRRATSADVDGIARVHVQAWEETYRGLVPNAAFDDYSVETRIAQWGSALANPDVLVNMIERDGTICGFGSGGRARAALQTDCEIYSFYLLDAVKRRGFGRALFDHMRSDLGALGHRSLGLLVLVNNIPARRFYEAMGGRTGGTHIDVRGELAFEDVTYSWDDLAGVG